MSDKNNPSIWIQKIAILLKPSRTIPHTPWRAESTWSLGLGRYHLERLLILIFGLTIFGLGDAFLIMSTLGNSPWTVLAEGISLNTPLNIGESTFIISVFILLLWIPLRQKPGFGTLANIVVIATAIELGLHIIPSTDNLSLQLFYIFLESR